MFFFDTSDMAQPSLLASTSTSTDLLEPVGVGKSMHIVPPVAPPASQDATIQIELMHAVDSQNSELIAHSARQPQARFSVRTTPIVLHSLRLPAVPLRAESEGMLSMGGGGRAFSGHLVGRRVGSCGSQSKSYVSLHALGVVVSRWTLDPCSLLSCLQAMSACHLGYMSRSYSGTFLM